MKMGSIYSASDKALYDAINSSTVSNSDLRSLFLKHGIIISTKTPRKVLAAHYSRLIHDHEDFQALAKLFDTGQRRERSSSFMVKGNSNINDYETAANELVEEIKKDTDSAQVIQQMDGSLKMIVRYKAYNFNKSEFKQVEVKKAIISIETDGDEILIRGPQNDKVDCICRDLIKKVSENTSTELIVDDINLELHTSAATRTAFFVNLIDLLNGYPRHTVTDVYVYKPNTKIEDHNDDDSDDEEKDSDLGIHIDKASLKGQGVLESKEFKSLLTNEEFYISKIVWQAKPSGIDSDIYEFEAQFSEPETCTRFSYLVRGYYKYISQQVFSKTKQNFLVEEEKHLNKVIENAARLCLLKVTS